MEFIILILFYLVVGFPLYCIYYNLFDESRLLFAVTFSVMLGFIFFNLYQVIFGHFGLPLGGVADYVYKISFLILTWGLLYFTKRYKPVKSILDSKIKWEKINKLNITLTAFLLLFYLYILKKINVTFYIPWDVFHIWLLDPKIIFETGYLRQGIDLIDVHKYYGSFLSVSISDLYELMGEIKERRAAYFTLMHAFFAGILLWKGISRNDTYSKLFGFAILFIVLSTFSACNWFYTNYTEVHCAFYILLFVYLLISLKKFHPNDYCLRVFLMACVLYILIDIKPYYPQVIFLCAVWAVHDMINYRKKFFKQLELKVCIPLLALFLFLIFSYKYYVFQFIDIVEEISEETRVKSLENTPKLLKSVIQELIPSSIKEGQKIYNTFDARIDRFITRFTLLMLSAMSILFLKKDDARVKYVIVSLLGIASIYLLYVVFIFPDVPRDSFYRYATLFFFLIPLVFAYKFSFSNKLESKILSISFIALAVANFSLTSFQLGVLQKKNHSGSYSEFRRYMPFEEVATKVKKVLDQDDRVLVVNAGKNKQKIVCTRSTRIVRYNLIGNVVGGLKFITDDKVEFRNTLSLHKVDYILAQNPKNNEILSKLLNTTFDAQGEYTFYLIKINNLENNDFTITQI